MIAIVDYKAGNLTSVRLALQEIGVLGEITADRDTILAADRVIFPGVGAAGAAMENIHRLNLEAILKDFLNTGKPMLGICVGAQVVLSSSAEDGGTACLNLIPGRAEKFQYSSDSRIKVPQIGWNQVRFINPHPLFDGVPSGSEFYFVHSYYPVPDKPEHQLAETTYGSTTFASIIGNKNLVACQFHLEKSGSFGLKLLSNFCRWNGIAPSIIKEAA